MKKTWIIIQREYLTRVRKRTFVLSTLLFPLLYLGLIFGVGAISESSKEVLAIAVVDSSGYFTKEALALENKIDESSVLTLVEKNNSNINPSENEGFDGYVMIPALQWKKGIDSLSLNTFKSYGRASTATIEAKLNRIWQRVLNDSLQIDESKQVILAQSHIGLQSRNVNDEQTDSRFADSIGYVAGFLIYFILLQLYLIQAQVKAEENLAGVRKLIQHMMRQEKH